MPSIYPLFERDSNGEKMNDVYGGYKNDYGINRGVAGLTKSNTDANYNTNSSLVHILNLNQRPKLSLADDLVYESNLAYT